MGGYPRSSSPALSSANQVGDLEPASYTSFHDLLPDGSWPNSPQPDESDKRQFWSRFLTSSPSSSPSPVPELPASPSINNNGDGSLDVSTSSSSVLMWDSANNSAQGSSDTRDSGLSSARAASPAGSLLTQGRKHSYPVPLSESGATPAPRIARQKQQQQQLNDRINHSNTKDAAAEALYQHEMSKGLDEDEELFNMEEELSKQSYVWEDKYRPRKPRYFNKVMTGFEWNKYNQTHYDYDNPPPKVVTGYRMVLFYPDLIDKTKAPTFNVLKSKDNPDVATLVFKAGPPYEDIAFQIVNREWEYSHKRGFRCSFDRGVLQLAFTFKRLHYRK